MILDKFVDVNITVRNITYFKEKGYEPILNEKLKIDVIDLARNSRLKVQIKCSECGIINNLPYHKCLDNIERYGFYTCKKCSTIKKKITFINNYGVDNPMKCDEIKQKGKDTKKEKYGDENYNNLEKYKETCIKKYGTNCALSVPQIRKKINKTCLEKYGTINASESPIVRNKIKNTKKEKYGNPYFNNWDKMSRTKLNKHNFNIIKIENNIINAICDKNHNFKLDYNIYYYRKNNNLTICPICNPISYNISSLEKDLVNFIKNNYNGNIILNSKKLLGGKELDIYLPDINIAFEFNGSYWHSNLKKDKYYHINKLTECIDNNIELIHIYEYQWLNMNDILKSNILNKLKIYKNIINSDNLEIKILNNTEVKDFIKINSMYDYKKSDVNIGLLYNNEIYSLVSFKKYYKSYKILNYCTKNYFKIINGYNKIFNFFKQKNKFNNVIVCAIRDFNDDIFTDMGFHIIKYTEPNTNYIKNNYKINYTKNKKLKNILEINDSGYIVYKYVNNN